MQITITQDIPIEKVQDLLVSAFDPVSHAVSYWCKVVKYIEPNYPMAVRLDTKGHVYQYADFPVNEGGAIVLEIEADNDDKDNGKRYSLGLKEIEAGLKVMAKEHPQHFSHFMTDDGDNETADVFVQCALFGEIIYG